MTIAMRRLLPIMAVLLLAGCGPNLSTPQGQCESQAEDDPTVHDLQMRGLGNLTTAQQLQPDINEAKKAATLRCLQARGLAPRGGVQKELRER